MEMLLRELDQAVQLLTNVFVFSALHQLQAQIVERVQEDAVLVIQGLYADDALVTPGKEGHINLHQQLASLSPWPGIEMALLWECYGTLDPYRHCAHSRITFGCGSCPRVVRMMA